ncbi:MAG: 1-acyl-sn-glycerol-3-phosphate acyltransferase [Acidobacteriota bacterium]|nr:1-acyl-sn-glycerol-3-phosphate acyltransferase [Acidobacteriota bacterium]
MRSSLVRIVRLVVGLFYRRIEVAGLEHVPREGAVLFIANHNNGLVDPMVVLWALSRPVVFVAKSTFWKIPVLRSLLDLLGCVPVVRKGEGEPGISLKGEERNTAAFERLSSVLDAGGCVLVFPEGRSHSDPRPSEIRTGAARVLLLSKKSPVVVPIGLWFASLARRALDHLLSRISLSFSSNTPPGASARPANSWRSSSHRVRLRA